MDVQALTAFLAVVIGVGGALSPFVTGIVALVKTTAGDALPARYYPAVSVTAGVLLAVALTAVAPREIGLSYRLAPLCGLMAGLIASSMFSWAKSQSEVIPPHG